MKHMLVKEKNPPNKHCSPYWHTVILFPVTEVPSLTWNWSGKCGERWDSLGNCHFQEHEEVELFSHSLSFLFTSSVQFSCSVVSDSLRPNELQHARPPCPSTNSRSLPKLMSIELVMPSTISSSVVPFSRLQSIRASGSFPVSQLFLSGVQSIGV